LEAAEIEPAFHSRHLALSTLNYLEPLRNDLSGTHGWISLMRREYLLWK
jgi:hypothetical protein